MDYVTITFKGKEATNLMGGSDMETGRSWRKGREREMM